MTPPAAETGPWNTEDAPLEPAEILDSDELGSTEAGRDPLDDTWDAPDRPSENLRFPATPREERRGASLDRLLAAELPDPDPYLEAERRASDPEGTRDDYTDGDGHPGEGSYPGDTGSDDYTGRDSHADRGMAARRTGTAEERALHIE
ncbi:hypothetical protein [Frankia sp. R82]|uniref:hypothetical protein n=1 Tax=Frankia sp. R82 TaxID=2950553 RepID=UPI002042CA0A|nr:hypothetical protein [Frankia sp. R82]MCM3884440.1 hypothetical protein [Frankia sp. R82]